MNRKHRIAWAIVYILFSIFCMAIAWWWANDYEFLSWLNMDPSFGP